MARTSKPESPYTIRVHRNGEYMYACTHSFRINEEGKRIYRTIHWGKITEDLTFVPGKHYLSSPLSERKKLIFPNDWKLDKVKDRFKSNLP